ncbi:uncharacterized protein LOC132580015 [Heteronotia binoei]|uniref:uncharacterized protein LOC132580015 n=1 Tax=Heteronotia binoei TaxID=13085 RepID=UPI00292FFA8A|nr:uncharacterized protein LOC132580015 [Heteronotia binoei]
MYKGSVTAATKTAEKAPAAVECSSSQLIKQPWMKKSIQKRQLKSHFHRRRPVNNTSQPKKGRGRSQDSNSYKRMIAYSPENRLKTYYSNRTGRQAKFPRESRVNRILPKTASKEEQSNSPGLKLEDRNACSPVCRTENPQPPLTERSRVSSTREKQKSKLTAVEKRRYQTVSEYQFIYPGKTMFHFTKESAKQQLRSIYLGPRRQKLLKPTHPSTKMPRKRWEKNETQRENTKTDASCPIGSEFLRSKHPKAIPCRLTSLMFKINKLELIDEMETVSPCALAGLPHSPQLQRQAPPVKSSFPAAALSRRGSPKERKTSPEGWPVELESSPDLSPQGATGNALKASPASSTKARPLSAKDCSGKAPSKKSEGEGNQNGHSSKKEDVAESTLGVSTSSKGDVTQTTNTMSAFHQLSSKENVEVEVPPNACSNIIQCPAEERQREQFPVAYRPSSAREEKISGALVHCSSGQKRQAYSIVTVGSK